MARPLKKTEMTTEDLVFKMAGLGHSKREIAIMLDLAQSTFDRRFRTYYEKGQIHTSLKLRAKCVQMAEDGDSKALIFALKNLAKWSDRTSTEISGPDGAALAVKYDYTELLKNPDVAKRASDLATTLDAVSSGNGISSEPGEVDSSESSEASE